MHKRVFAIGLALVVIASSWAGTASAAEEQGISCSSGFHSYLISPNTFCFSGDEEAGGAMGCAYVKDNYCSPSAHLVESTACYSWPAGVSFTCTWR